MAWCTYPGGCYYKFSPLETFFFKSSVHREDFQSKVIFFSFLFFFFYLIQSPDINNVTTFGGWQKINTPPPCLKKILFWRVYRIFFTLFRLHCREEWTRNSHFYISVYISAFVEPKIRPLLWCVRVNFNIFLLRFCCSKDSLDKCNALLQEQLVLYIFHILCKHWKWNDFICFRSFKVKKKKINYSTHTYVIRNNKKLFILKKTLNICFY